MLWALVLIEVEVTVVVARQLRNQMAKLVPVPVVVVRLAVVVVGLAVDSVEGQGLR